MVDIIQSYYPGSGGQKSASHFDLVRPHDGCVTGRIAEAGATGVERAVSAAHDAFLAIRKKALHERVRWLRLAADAVRSQAEALAAIIVEDVGKPIRACRFEVQRGVELLEACAASASQIGGEVLPLDATPAGSGLIGMTRRLPYGVVGAITPFNAPINLLVQKLAPAIAAGNTVVVKPAPAGTRTALRLAELFHDRGWPEGLFSVVTGDRETALALASHPLVRAVSFTGGTNAGESLARAAGAKKFLAELGSNAANIVMADADLEAAARKIAAAAFEASGQQCISAQRVLVQKQVFEEFCGRFVAAAAALKVGPAEDPGTDLATMVSGQAADRVMEMIADAIQRGAVALLEPKRQGAMISPAILGELSREARLWREEVFGPVAVLVPFETIDEAIALANDSPFGLQGAVFTGSLATALRFADDFEVGSLWVNEASRFRLDMYPFGGVKQSGVGREGVKYAIEEMTQIKFIGIRPGA
ncbi:MAG: aldehyde dehydrogenase family protein [Alphaproteobacteria bacterium]|nr:aldehyde dehydrogenase family protein [Alphaproteobacteria bacterium]